MPIEELRIKVQAIQYTADNKDEVINFIQRASSLKTNIPYCIDSINSIVIEEGSINIRMIPGSWLVWVGGCNPLTVVAEHAIPHMLVSTDEPSNN